MVDSDRDPMDLLQSADPEDRAHGAFLLGSVEYTPDVADRLMACLFDGDSDVAAYAAQSLALQGDGGALETVLRLLEDLPGLETSPVAWAAAALAVNAEPDESARVYSALLRLRGRGSPAVVHQVDILLGR